MKSASHQASSGPARPWDAVARVKGWPLDARIKNHGFQSNISVNIRKCIVSHTESWRISSLLVSRCSNLIAFF